MTALESTVVNILTPSEYFLSQNCPNPFSEKTKIKYCVAYKTRVRLEVFDAEGNLVQKLIDEEKEAGAYEIEFDTAGIVSESSLQGGMFYYRLTAGDYKCEKKMILQK